MQIFAVGHSVNRIIDRYNDFVSSRKCTDTNFFFTCQDETSDMEEKRPDIVVSDHTEKSRNVTLVRN